ncbi:receptor kinase-like protein Xa21 [Triticum aestivum]|uniref:receptor kinase-like protein Xa21 n=1 Tax=Triticum aestivum TaxID=4565 RepID=UPI001D012632|nr:receptor kinase-like protein Xa21 [Triticum aestivum]
METLLFPGLCRLLCLFLGFFCSLPLLGICDESESDRQALLCFKSGLSAPAGVLTSWSNVSMEFCNWHGITCGAMSPQRVIALDLESQGISGSIRPCIANLTWLARLQLSNNSFGGGVPSELGLLSRLTNLNLSMNTLEGTIPPQLSACSQLQVLGLRKNSLSGEIPARLSECKHLQEINLSKNKLQGSIPPAFANLPELRILDLASNTLTGNIPPSLGSCRHLTYVDLGINALGGVIPESLANSSSLQVLRLMSNSLTGELPKALLNTLSLGAICLAQNNFVGSIPSVTVISSPLKHLYLGENHLSGRIPSSLGNLSSLLRLHLTNNHLVGSIPESLGYIPTLEKLVLSANNLSGPVPPSIFNMSSLKSLAAFDNSLVGRLPFDIGYTLQNIEYLILTGNNFDGPIPASLLKAYRLRWLLLNSNRFIGSIPFFGSLPNLVRLDLASNELEADDWGFVSSLSNCSRLNMLALDGNNLNGKLPSSIGNLSNSLDSLWLNSNQISGPIPPEIGNLKSLSILYMEYNFFTGNIPPTIGKLNKLVKLSFAHNRLLGQIPDTVGNLVQLSMLELDHNNFSGRIPASIARCTQLTILNLAHNSLDGRIPSKILTISTLSIELDLSNNNLSGGMPDEVGSLLHLKKINMSNNRLTGNIPSTLGQCVDLEYLQMQNNLFAGRIPQTFANLVSIKHMDISGNNLSGKVPEFLKSLKSLQDLNLSFNHFDGAVPTGGVFDIAGAVSIEGNDHLCTIIPTRGMSLCMALADSKKKQKLLVLVLVILLPIVAATAILLSCIVTIYWRKRMQETPHLQYHNEHIKKIQKISFEQISYEDLLRATDRFSSANLIGSGSFGRVYKGSLQFQADQVAIKIFDLDINGADRSFIAECEALRNVRHRNLVKIITSCSSVDHTGADFKALVFPYMPNGNLEMWLHLKDPEDGEKNILSLSQRTNIALDVAVALDYLHNQCAPPVIHCDLKPSNILLGLDMAAHVIDFGLARFLFSTANAHQDSSASLSRLKGSIGYIPPEYGMSEEISTKGDVYSFGVLLLQLITGCSPTDEKFNDGISLHEFVDRAFTKNIHEVVDPTMLQDNSNATDMMENCVIPLLRIGLSCSMASPKERPDMGQVSTEILRIKHVASDTCMSDEAKNWQDSSKQQKIM